MLVQAFGFLTSMLEFWLESWLLVSPWPNPGYCSYLGSGPMGGITLSPFLSLSVALLLK